MNKFILWIIVAAVVLVGLWLLFSYTKPQPAVAPSENEQILSDLEGLNLGDLNTEFQGVDSDLNQL